MSTLPIILLLLFVGCKQATNKIIDTYPSGQTKTEYIYPGKSDTSKYTCNVYYETGLAAGLVFRDPTAWTEAD